MSHESRYHHRQHAHLYHNSQSSEQFPFFGKAVQNNKSSFFQTRTTNAQTPVAKYASANEQSNSGISEVFSEIGNNTNLASNTRQDGEGLRNPRFKGDPQLEACFDHQLLFKFGSQGNAVAKIQSGISDYFTHKGEDDPLPQFGSDGVFGSETKGAVADFQEDVGFKDREIDGVVGHNTMDELDRKVPAKELPNPKPKDTDEDCMGCKPISKVTKVNKDKSTTTFALCNDDFDVFNTGAGTVVVGPGCVAKNSNKTGKVNFNSGTSGKPAWQEKADLHDCTTPPPKANAKPEWETGFIQTLDSATFGASYENNNFVNITNKDARDALTATVPAPWYDDKGNNFGPQEYPTVPIINDTPNVNFNIAHPDTGKDFIKSACMKAKFNIWLVINKIGNTPAETNVDFLHHWSIDINQGFLLSGDGAHPCNQSQWMAIGKQTMSDKGSGRGTKNLVWDKPIAKGNEVLDTTLKKEPCK